MGIRNTLLNIRSISVPSLRHVNDCLFFALLLPIALFHHHTYRQPDVFRHLRVRNVGKRFVRTPTLDIFGHFRGRSVAHQWPRCGHHRRPEAFDIGNRHFPHVAENRTGGLPPLGKCHQACGCVRGGIMAFQRKSNYNLLNG